MFELLMLTALLTISLSQLLPPVKTGKLPRRKSMQKSKRAAAHRSRAKRPAGPRVHRGRTVSLTGERLGRT